MLKDAGPDPKILDPTVSSAHGLFLRRSNGVKTVRPNDLDKTKL